jgi:glutathione synthase/RimK-type ligase-like ATP-grasp enzyme
MSIELRGRFESFKSTQPKARNLLAGTYPDPALNCRAGANERAMLNSQRIFVDAVKRYCSDHGIAVEIRSQGWLIVMRREGKTRFTLGYDVGLNSAMAHRIANDKSATAEVLAMSGTACIPHTLFLNPRLSTHIPPGGSWEQMLDLLERSPKGVVVKPNEGTSGRDVILATNRPALELAVNKVFASHLGLAISPYVEIEDEIRVILIDGVAAVVYRKDRPSVTGDGKHSLLELALAATPPERRSVVLPGMLADVGRAELDAVLPPGQRRVLNWRHNLDSGATPILLDEGDIKTACVRLAVRAAQAIGIRFASIDVVRAGGDWKVLEINSGVMMEALSRRHPDLVDATYRAALDKVFEEIRT